jgi:transposase-like protein
MYLYRVIDSNGDTVEFWFSERRNLTAAKHFLRKALKRHGSTRADRDLWQSNQQRSDPVV